MTGRRSSQSEEERGQRLAKALRENLRRRKSKVRRQSPEAGDVERQSATKMVTERGEPGNDD